MRLDAGMDRQGVKKVQDAKAALAKEQAITQLEGFLSRQRGSHKPRRRLSGDIVSHQQVESLRAGAEALPGQLLCSLIDCNISLASKSSRVGSTQGQMLKPSLGSSDASHRRRLCLSPAVLMVMLDYMPSLACTAGASLSRLSRERTVLVDQVPSMQVRPHSEVDHLGFLTSVIGTSATTPCSARSAVLSWQRC